MFIVDASPLRDKSNIRGYSLDFKKARLSLQCFTVNKLVVISMEACLIRAGVQIYLCMLVGDGLIWLSLRVVCKTAVGEK